MNVELGVFHVRNPPLWQVEVVAVAIGTVAGTPLFVLMSARARRQFKHKPDPPAHESLQSSW